MKKSKKIPKIDQILVELIDLNSSAYCLYNDLENFLTKNEGEVERWRATLRKVRRMISEIEHDILVSKEEDK